MNYSRRQLEALGEPLGDSVTRLKPGGRIYGGGGGGGGPTTSTVTQSNIPDWLRPQVEGMLGAATQQMFKTTPQAPVYDAEGKQTNTGAVDITGFNPYVPYSTNPADYVAGFSPMQNQAFQSAANLQTPGQFGAASDMAAGAGLGAMQSVAPAYGYGAMGAGYGGQGSQAGLAGLNYGNLGSQVGMTQGQRYGAQGAGYGSQGAGLGVQGGQQYGGLGAQYGAQGAAAGAAYGQQATNPAAVQAYMNPYLEASLAPQMALMDRAAAQQQMVNQAQAVGQNAFGGNRGALLQAQNQLNNQLAKNQLVANAYNQAFNTANQNMQAAANLGIQGAQAGMQGAGVGLQGVNAQLAGTAQGMQGAGVGLQGAQTAMQGAQTGIQGAQAGIQGAQTGIQGAQTGLQGVAGAQSGYNLANQAAQTLGGLGTAQLNAQTGIIGLQNQLGQQQQARQQEIINNAINNYAMAQQYPMQQLSQYNALLRGYATPTTTTQQYQAAPSATSQMVGLGTAGIGLSSLAKAAGGKAGGKVSQDGIDKLAMRKALAGA